MILRALCGWRFSFRASKRTTSGGRDDGDRPFTAHRRKKGILRGSGCPFRFTWIPKPGRYSAEASLLLFFLRFLFLFLRCFWFRRRVLLRRCGLRCRRWRCRMRSRLNRLRLFRGRAIHLRLRLLRLGLRTTRWRGLGMVRGWLRCRLSRWRGHGVIRWRGSSHRPLVCRRRISRPIRRLIRCRGRLSRSRGIRRSGLTRTCCVCRRWMSDRGRRRLARRRLLHHWPRRRTGGRTHGLHFTAG